MQPHPRPRTRSRDLAVLLPLVLASCVAPPPPRAAPVPARVAPPPRTAAPVPVSNDWRDLPQSPGTWVYRAGEATTEARFGVADAAPDLILRCERASGRVALERAVSATGPLIVTTTDGRTALPAVASARRLVATLAGTDALLDRIAFTRGRFLVAAAGSPTLALPAWGEVSRVIEDCRP